MNRHGSGVGAEGKLIGTSMIADFVDRFAIIGPPDLRTERLLELIRCGIERFVIVGPGLHPEPAGQGQTLFASEVIPAARSSS